MWTFVLKMFMKLLPLATHLKLRRPRIYQYLKCPSCADDQVESVSHILSCSGYRLLWEQLFSELKSTLRVQLLKTFADHPNKDAHVDIILWTILGTSAVSDSFLDLKAHGIEMKIRSSLIKKLLNHDLCTKSIANKLLITVLWEFVKLFKTIIWKARCDQMIIWEKDANITTLDKRTTPRRHERRLRSISDDSTLITVDSPICYDDPPINSGVPINTPRPPGITRAQRLASASIHIPCQINALIHHNVINPWIFKAKDCFNKTVLSI